MSVASEVLASGWTWLFLFLGAAGVLVWQARGTVAWLSVGVAVLTGFSLAADATPFTLIFTWLLFGVALAAATVPSARQRLISERMFRLMRDSLPEISETERQSLASGGTGWEAELFGGRPEWRRLHDVGSRPRLSDAERSFLDGPVEELCEMINDFEVNSSSRGLPAEAWGLMKRAGFFGLTTPEEFGGKGFAPCAYAAVLMKIASRSLSTAWVVMTPNSGGLAGLLLAGGTEEQKRRYLPRIANGEEIPCLAVSGPESGSDAASMPDRGVVCYGDLEGEEGVLGVRLNFDKCYVSLAPMASLICVAFKLDDADGLLNGQGNHGITLALVPVDRSGVESGERHDAVHMGIPYGPVRGRDVFVPIDSIIGGAEGIGRGWELLTDSQTDTRGVAAPALSCGAAKMAARVTGAFARVRYQFRAPIASFEGVQASLAMIAGNTYAMEATRQLILAELDGGGRPSVAASLVKYNLSQRCREVLNNAMDVHAGAGIAMGPDNLIGEIHKFAPVGVTFAGPDILTRGVTTFRQGVIRCHPCLMDEIEAVSGSGSAAVASFDKVFARHCRLLASNLLRTLILGLAGARPSRQWKQKRGRKKLSRPLTRLSAAFALTTDVMLLTQRGAIRQRERLSARMADVLSQLYIISAASRLYELAGRHESDRLLLEWVVADSFQRAQRAFDAICRNLPGRFLGRVLWRVLFPWGKPWAPPPDSLDASLSDLVSVPSSARDRLTSGIYLPVSEAEPLSRLETALGKVTMTVELANKLRTGQAMELVGEGPFEQRIDAAVEGRLLTPAEAEELRAAEQARRDALRIDAQAGGPGAA